MDIERETEYYWGREDIIGIVEFVVRKGAWRGVFKGPGMVGLGDRDRRDGIFFCLNPFYAFGYSFSFHFPIHQGKKKTKETNQKEYFVSIGISRLYY